MVSLPRQRNYFLLWTSSLISALGNWMLVAALPYYVYATTGSTVASGAAFISEMLPMVLLPSIGGIFADRWDRKQVMVLSDFLRAGIVLLLLGVHSSSTIWLVYVAGFVGSTVAYFAGPFGNAAIPQLVGEEQLPAANGGFVVGGNVARVLGPALAGILIVRSGLTLVVLLDALSFVVSGFLAASLVFPPGNSTDEITKRTEQRLLSQGWQEWREGVTYLGRHPLLAALFAVILLSCLSDGFFTPLLAPFVRHTLAASAQTYGTLVSVRGVGGLVAGLLVDRVSVYLRPAILIGGTTLLIAAVDFLVLIAVSVPVTLVGMALVSLGGTISFVQEQSLFQSAVINRYRGRVFGTLLTAIALSVLAGTALGSVLAGLIGIRLTMGVGAALTAGTGLLALATMRDALDGLREVEHAPACDRATPST